MFFFCFFVLFSSYFRLYVCIVSVCFVTVCIVSVCVVSVCIVTVCIVSVCFVTVLCLFSFYICTERPQQLRQKGSAFSNILACKLFIWRGSSRYRRLHWSTKVLSHEEKCLCMMYFWTQNSNMFVEFLYRPHLLLCIRMRDRPSSFPWFGESPQTMFQIATSS
jgi:hypothetical protein